MTKKTTKTNKSKSNKSTNQINQEIINQQPQLENTTSKTHINNKKNFYFFAIAYLLAIITLVIIFKPFLYALILGGILGIFFFPINKKLQKIIPNKQASSLILVIIIFILLIITTYLIGYTITKEVTNAYQAILTYDYGDIDIFIENTTGITTSTEEFLTPLIKNIKGTQTQNMPNLIGSAIDLIVGLFIMLFLIYYVFKDGEELLENILNTFPVSTEHKTQIKEESKKVLYGVMYGQVLMALVQGLIGGLAFYIFGLPNPVFWGLIMAILAFIPIVGTPAVWLPAGIIQLMQGNLISGIGVLAVGTIIIFTIENIIKPRVIGKRSGMHTLLVLLGIIGGIMLFGVLGMIIGPILVALCVLIIKIFTQEVITTKK